jgi:hypothetical protein
LSDMYVYGWGSRSAIARIVYFVDSCWMLLALDVILDQSLI